MFPQGSVAKPEAFVMMGLSRNIWALLLAMMVGIALLDDLTGKYLSVWGLYLIPIIAASWIGGFGAGVLTSGISCALIFIAGIVGGTMFAGIGYFLLGIFNRFTAFFMVSWLASHLFNKQMLEAKLKSCEEYMDYLHASPSDRSDQQSSNSDNTGTAS